MQDNTTRPGLSPWKASAASKPGNFTNKVTGKSALAGYASRWAARSNDDEAFYASCICATQSGIRNHR